MIAEGITRVPVSDPECTRFWMHADEAVALVIKALHEMKGGDMFIPDWLPAYRLGDLAEAMGVEMDIRGIGLYEKRHESMDNGLSSDKARRMTVDEIREALKNV